MATMLESGQIMLRGAQGGVPMVQPSIQPVEPIAARAAAQQSETMAQLLDRMSTSAFQEAGRLAQQEAIKFAADNPPTPEQIELAKNGVPLPREMRGSIYNEALRKARSLQLASHFEIEGRNELAKILTEVQNGSITGEQASQKIATFTSGYSKTLAGEDPEAAIKFRATMALHGNSVLNAAYEAQMKRDQQQKLIKLDNDMIAVGKLMFNTARLDPDRFNLFADTHRRNVSTTALSLGNAAVQKEYADKFEKMVVDTKVAVITSQLQNDAYYDKPMQTVAAIRSGTLGFGNKYNGMLSDLMTNNPAALDQIVKTFRAEVSARNSAIEAEYKNADRAADSILQQIYMTRNPAQASSLFDSLASLPVSPEKIKAARSWIDGDAVAGPQRDDLEQLGTLNQRISLGLATQSEIIDAPGITRKTKEQMLGRFGNVTDDIGAATRSIERAVGIFSSALPPELPSPQAKALAVQTRNENVGALYEFARTPGPDGRLPSPPQIREYGLKLAQESAKIVSQAFVVIAPAAEQEARMALTELAGVDLLDDKAVEEAIKKAVQRGAAAAKINAVRDSINRFRDAKARSGAAQ